MKGRQKTALQEQESIGHQPSSVMLCKGTSSSSLHFLVFSFHRDVLSSVIWMAMKRDEETKMKKPSQRSIGQYFLFLPMDDRWSTMPRMWSLWRQECPTPVSFLNSGILVDPKETFPNQQIHFFSSSGWFGKVLIEMKLSENHSAAIFFNNLLIDSWSAAELPCGTSLSSRISFC